MAEQKYPCENCKFRAHYDKNPKSALGRFWRWHINFCPASFIALSMAAFG